MPPSETTGQFRPYLSSVNLTPKKDHPISSTAHSHSRSTSLRSCMARNKSSLPSDLNRLDANQSSPRGHYPLDSSSPSIIRPPASHTHNQGRSFNLGLVSVPIPSIPCLLSTDRVPSSTGISLGEGMSPHTHSVIHSIDKGRAMRAMAKGIFK